MRVCARSPMQSSVTHTHTCSPLISLLNLSRAVAAFSTGSLTTLHLAEFRNPNAYLCGACKDLLFILHAINLYQSIAE